MGVFQTQNRIGVPDKAKIIAIFDTNHVTKSFVEIDGARYPKDGVSAKFEENSHLDQYRDIKIFYREYVVEQLLDPYISYTDMRNVYLIEAIDLRFQVDHITTKISQLFEDFFGDPDNEKLFVILNRHRQIETISDGKKFIENKVYKKYL